MSNEMIPFEQMQTLAVATAKSGFFAGIQNSDQAIVLMCIAQAEGCHPIQAMQRYHVIKGKPCKQAWAMLSDFTQSGGKVEWIEHSENRCAATFSHPLGGIVTVDWTIEKAKNAGLLGNDTWRKYPENMLHARCVSNGVRFCYPAASNGLYTPEEVEDFDKPFANIPAEKPIERKVERVAKSEAVDAVERVLDGKVVEPKKKWGPSEPIPAAVRRAVPALQVCGETKFIDMDRETLELIVEMSSRSITEWTGMPGANEKLLALLNFISVSATDLLASRQ